MLYQYHLPTDLVDHEQYITAVATFPVIHNLILIMRKYQQSLICGILYKVMMIFESVDVTKNKERQKLSQAGGD